MSPAYTPRPGSLAEQVCAWFKAYPGCKISGPEIRERFNVSHVTVSTQMGALEDADFVTSERVGTANHYRAGPELANWAPSAALLAAAVSSKSADPIARSVFDAAKPKRHGIRLPPLDAAQVRIVANAPMPVPVQQRGRTRYDELLDKLDAPGKSAFVPRQYANAIEKACKSYAHNHRATRPGLSFKVARISDTEAQVYRIS